MTALRQQLRSAAREYCSVRYPGDLAAEVLPAPRSSSSGATRQLAMYRIGAVTAAAAALVLIAVFLRPPVAPQAPVVTGATGDRFVLRPPTGVAVPTIHVPTLPRQVPEPLPQGIEIREYQMRYDDLAQQVPQITPSLRRLTVPKLSDLPDRGIDWLHKVWTADESA